MPYYHNLRQTLTDSGYIPLPIIPKDKRPAIKEWTAPDYVPPKGFGGHGIGLLCGRGDYPLAGIDCDVTDEKTAAQMHEFILDLCGETVYRIGKAPKCMYVYRAEQTGLRKVASAQYKIGRVELCAFGQQFIAFGTHPGTGQPYDWPGLLGSVIDVPASELPVLSPDKLTAVIEHFEKITEGQGYQRLSKEKTKTDTPNDYDPEDPLDMEPPIGLTADKCRKMLSDINPDAARDEWVNLGMALHHEFKGADVGLDLWTDWSEGGEKFKHGETERLWESFGRYTGRPITAAYLLKLSKELAPEPETKNLFRSLPWSTDRFLDDPPEVPMVVHGMLPRGIVSILYSAGGAGKSTVVLSMAIKIALAKSYDTDVFGHSIQGGSVVIVTAEDPDLILNRRFMGVLRGIAEEMDVPVQELRQVVTDRLHIVSTIGENTQLFKLKKDGNLGTTGYYDELVDCLAEIKNLQLVIIDTKSRYSPAEGQGNVTATQEITLYEAIVKRCGGASIMLLHHTNKASRDGSQTGAQAYRDATALFDSVRAAWFLRALTEAERKTQGIPEDDTETYMLFENAKNNYIPICQPMVLKREGFRFLHSPVKPKVSGADKKELRAQQAYDRVIEALQNSKGELHKQGDLIQLCREHGLGRYMVVNALQELGEDGLIFKTENHIGAITVCKYTLTDEGKQYKLTLDAPQ